MENITETLDKKTNSNKGNTTMKKTTVKNEIKTNPFDGKYIKMARINGNSIAIVFKNELFSKAVSKLSAKIIEVEKSNNSIKITKLNKKLIELNEILLQITHNENFKKEDKKLIKLIEKQPTKKEIKASQHIELTENSKKVTLINDSINSNFETYLSNKKTIKELQQNNTKIISEIFKEVQILLIDYKAFLDKNNTLNMEFNKKSLIQLLRIKLENNLNKELFSIYSTVLDYMSYNLTMQLNVVSYTQLKSIVNAYKLQLDGNVYYTSITKNKIAKLKTKEDYTLFLKDISTIKSTIKKDIIIAELIKNKDITLNEKVA